jgi:hypothetical protein
MDREALLTVVRAAAAHTEDATRAAYLAGFVHALKTCADIVDDGLASPEWVQAVRIMVALQEEHGNV